MESRDHNGWRRRYCAGLFLPQVFRGKRRIGAEVDIEMHSRTLPSAPVSRKKLLDGKRSRGAMPLTSTRTALPEDFAILSQNIRTASLMIAVQAGRNVA